MQGDWPALINQGALIVCSVSLLLFFSFKDDLSSVLVPLHLSNNNSFVICKRK